MIVWSKTKEEISEPEKVVLVKLPRSNISKSNKRRIENFNTLRRRQWAEDNPILYAGILNDREKQIYKKVENVKRVFTKRFNLKRFSRYASRTTKFFIIRKLVRYCGVKINPYSQYETRRTKDRTIKLLSTCIACGSVAQVMHHVIMICNGGPNVRSNCVPLCNPCHREIHPWLK